MKQPAFMPTSASKFPPSSKQSPSDAWLGFEYLGITRGQTSGAMGDGQKELLKENLFSYLPCIPGDASHGGIYGWYQT